MNLQIKKGYSIVFKGFLSSKEFFIKPSLFGPDYFSNDGYKEEFIKKFKMFDSKICNITTCYELMLKTPPYIDVCNAWVYEVVQDNNQKTNIIEILDLAVNMKHRSKGIGSQVISLLEEIALNNNIDCIIGELQEGRNDEPLEKRKEFFIKNGFSVWYDKKSDVSGWLIKKSLKN